MEGEVKEEVKKEEVKEEVKKEEESSEEDTTDNDSDLDMTIEELARTPVRPQRRSGGQEGPPTQQSPEEVVDLDSDAETEIVDQREGTGEQSPVNEEEHGNDNRRYGLRKRNPRGMPNASGDKDNDKIGNDHSPPKRKRNKKRYMLKDILDLSLLLAKSEESEKLRNKLMKQPIVVEKPGKWRLSCEEIKSEKFDATYCNTTKKFLEENARHMDHLVLELKRTSNEVWDMILDVVSCICRPAIFMNSLSIFYSKEIPEEARQLLHILERIKGSGQIALKSLRIISGSSGGFINTEELEALNELLESGIKLTDVELGDAILVSKDLTAVNNLAKFLELGQDTLEKLVIHGGFKGSSDVDYEAEKSKFMIQFPKRMSVLKKLSICPTYTFETNFYDKDMDPGSHRSEEVTVDSSDDKPSVPITLTVVLDHTHFPKLEDLALGNMIEMEECSFGLLRNLKTFRCGSRWDLIVRFPKMESKKGPGHMKEIQFPDGLKDPSFVMNVAKFFPSVQKVFIYLPSVAVLRTFFDAYQNSSFLEELYLITMFDFETTMESCLLSDQSKKGKLSETSKAAIKKLKEYKHFEEYARYHNIELPLECRDDQDQLPSNGAGIRGLKCLQVLRLQHAPRKLLIPNRGNERKWYDNNFKHLTTKFGSWAYLMSKNWDAEINAMNLRDYRYHNIKTSTSESSTNWYRDVPSSSSKSLERKDPLPTTTTVGIKPSMLLPHHFNKNKTESH